MAEETKSPKGSETGTVDNAKALAAISYIIFFIPMLMNPRNDFAMFHAKQSLVLLIASLLGSFVLGFIPIIGWIILPFFELAIFVLFILGIINALNGKEQELPVIGQFASNFKF